MYRWPLIFVAVILLIGCLLPLVQVAHWVGHFDLTVTLEADPDVELGSLRFFKRDTREFAEHTLNTRGEELEIQRLPSSTDDTIIFSIMCHGQSTAFGLWDKYYQPQFLVVEFSVLTDNGPQVCRKLLPIPEGRGDRTAILSLP